MIHIAIVEDEDVWAEKINHYLKKYEIENQIPFHISRFHDGAEIADDYSGGHDIIFMDIEMGLMNGMEAAEQIRTKDEQVIIIFVTNMSQYAIRGYKVNALDYVLKPITYIPFSQTLRQYVPFRKQKKIILRSVCAMGSQKSAQMIFIGLRAMGID